MYILGVDIGTTGTKAMLVRDDCTIISRAYRGYPLYATEGNCVEQNAEDWWGTLVSTVNECVKEIGDRQNIRAISVSTQGGSMVPLDANGELIRNAMVWMDSRGSSEMDSLLSKKGEDWFYYKTGWKLNIGLNAVKIEWLRNNERETFKRAAKYLTTLDYINYRLTGNYYIDPTNAAMTQLMDVSKVAWDDETLEMLGISEEQLPEICPSGCVLGHLSKNAARELGLHENVIVVNGGHDQYCGAIGAGAINDGDILLSTGSAWVVLGISNRYMPVNNSYVTVGRHIRDGFWGILSSVPTAGVSMEWFRKNLSLKTEKEGVLQAENFSEIDRKAYSRMESARELLFYPYYNGKGFPESNNKVRTGLLGLSLKHDTYDIARAVMEGVAFEVRRIIDGYREIGVPTGNLRIIGGAARSTLWMEIVSSIVDSRIIRFKETDMACIGAAIIAGKACGIFSGFEEGSGKIDAGELIKPSGSLERDFYTKKYERYLTGMKLLEAFYK